MPDIIIKPTPSLTALPNPNSTAPFLADLQKNGWCVIPAVIPKDRCEQYEEDALSWLEGCGLGFKRDDKSTWKRNHLPHSWTGGMFNKASTGHEDWVWRARCEPGVIAAFKELWGTDELLVSFDGFNVTLPHGPHGRTDIEPTKPWPHQDQTPHVKTFEIAQGIIAISESGPDDGGLVVLEGSHLLHGRYYEENGGIKEERRKGAEHGYHYGPNDVEWYQQNGCKEIKIECPAGSAIIWDSRLIHWNRMPTGSKTRIATYVCYCPASFATPEALQEKAEVYRERLNTSHWPASNFKEVDRETPRLENGEIDPGYHKRPLKEPRETQQLLRLAGVTSY